MKKIFAVGLTFVLGSVYVRGAMTYPGNGISSFSDQGFGGAVGTGSLTLTDDGTTVSGTLTRGSGSFSDILVIFIDSKANGFTSTANFSDAGSTLRKAVSGWDGSTRAIAEFASGFAADYAIALRPAAAADNNQLFQLMSPGSHSPVTTVNLNPTSTSSSSTYTFSFNWSDIGVTPGAGASFNFESDLVNSMGVHSLESFELIGGESQNTVTFTNYHTYVTAVPETTNAALGVFGGILLVAGALANGARLLKKKARPAVTD